MTQISALLSGTNQNYDYQLTALARALINPGVITGLAVSSGSVAAGEAFILCTRTNGQMVMIHYTNTASVTIDTSGSKKVWVGIDQSIIDDGSSNAIDGTGIATIRTGASYPSANYIPLASISGGVITDARILINGKPIKRKGLTANRVIVTDGNGDETESTTLPSVVMQSIAQDSNILNAAGNAGKYTQTVALGEDLGSGIFAMAIVNTIAYQPTLGSNANGNLQNDGIIFSVPYNCTLRTVKTHSSTTSGSGAVLLRDGSGNVLDSKTVANGADTVTFSYNLTAGTTYQLVTNDSVNWGGNRMYTDKSAYTTAFPYFINGLNGGAVSTLYGLMFNYIEIDFNGKAYKARGDRTIENQFARFSGFVSGPLTAGVNVSMNNNAFMLVSGFSGLTVNMPYWISNTAGSISTTPGTVKNLVGHAPDTSSIIISPRSSLASSNSGGTFNHKGGIFTALSQAQGSSGSVTASLSISCNSVNIFVETISVNIYNTAYVIFSQYLPPGTYTVAGTNVVKVTYNQL